MIWRKFPDPEFAFVLFFVFLISFIMILFGALSTCYHTRDLKAGSPTSMETSTSKPSSSSSPSEDK
jgi:hypothetical protein